MNRPFDEEHHFSVVRQEFLHVRPPDLALTLDSPSFPPGIMQRHSAIPHVDAVRENGVPSCDPAGRSHEAVRIGIVHVVVPVDSDHCWAVVAS
jgi:hypothetical protein